MDNLGHGGPRGHPGNEEEAAQDRLAVQVRSQDWQQPCQSHQHTGEATRTRLKQDRGDQDWVPETVGRVRLDKRLEQELGGKEWWSVLRSDSGDGGVFEMCLGCGNQSGQQGRKEAGRGGGEGREMEAGLWFCKIQARALGLPSFHWPGSSW